ncbi:hypothetical protein VTI74DRAFT_4921 [Chaetomium olivicolor]
MRSTSSIALALSAGLRLANAAPCPGTSSTLYVASYPSGQLKGGLTTLRLSQGRLESVGEASDDCGPYPSWLTQAGNSLYCLDEAWANITGTVHSFKIGASSGISHLGSVETKKGPVSSIVYGDNGHGLAVADYDGQGLNTFNIADPAAIVPLDAPTFPPNSAPGTAQQTQSRPHQAILDPTGSFLVVPDLGNDLVRVFSIDKKTLKITEQASLEFARTTGPRHAAFFKSGPKTFLYVACEIANLVQGFSVSYNNDRSLSFTRIYNSSTHGDSNPLPAGATAAEIQVSPDSKFLTVSSRNENSLKYTLADGTTVDSDPLITFSINPESGALTHVQTAPAGGVNPRHFSFNKDGSRVASALQADGRVVVFEREVATGKIGKAVAEAKVAGSPNFVMFKE